MRLWYKNSIKILCISILAVSGSVGVDDGYAASGERQFVALTLPDKSATGAAAIGERGFIPLKGPVRGISQAKMIPLHGNTPVKEVSAKTAASAPEASIPKRRTMKDAIESAAELKLASLDYRLRNTRSASKDTTTALDDEAPTATRRNNSRPKNEETGYYWPVKGATRISSGYGQRIHPITKKKSFHRGIDIPAPTGTTVMSVASGKVIGVGMDPRLGRFVKVLHEDGGYSLYGHLHQATVKHGMKVKGGDPIGKVGTTGRSTAPHLHLSLHKKGGTTINPVALLPDMREKTLVMNE